MTKHIADAFQFCPRCGAETQATGTSPFACKECGFVFYFSPVAAVGGIVVNSNNELLFLVRGRDPGKGKFGLPGGFVDPGEPLEKSLSREVMEETSLTVTRASYLCSFPNQYTYRGITIDVLDVFFECRVDSFDPLTAQPGEVESFHIARPSLEILDRFAFESNRRAVEFFLTQE
ncbi:MAG: NUDIX domain-containing protein [Planctomycetaceae bacterium]|nr:NUDIX domain-containing protein [Planctomycetaceae bacterium]MCP4478586.1 NUDIX domain-containing protein [Planctomycetaceae bacterium]